MVKTEKYKTENLEMHLYLLTAMHSYAKYHPKEIVEIDYHLIPSQKSVYKLREHYIASTYHLGNVTIQHVTGEENHVSFTGKSKNLRSKAREKLQHITRVELSPLEDSKLKSVKQHGL